MAGPSGKCCLITGSLPSPRTHAQHARPGDISVLVCQNVGVCPVPASRPSPTCGDCAPQWQETRMGVDSGNGAGWFRGQGVDSERYHKDSALFPPNYFIVLVNNVFPCMWRSRWRMNYLNCGVCPRNVESKWAGGQWICRIWNVAPPGT